MANDNHQNESTHDRLIRLEERVKLWMVSVERRLAGNEKLVYWVLGMLGLIVVGVMTALLVRGL